MARVRSPNRDKALELFKESKCKLTTKEIAEKLNEKYNTVASWRKLDKWGKIFNKKVGAPEGNQNAAGNRGGGAPEGNQNARILGLYSKYMPKKVVSIYKDIANSNFSKLDILWHEICQQYATIIEAQRILNIKNNKDHTKVLKKETYGENASIEEYIVLTAFDKQVSKLKALSNARKTLVNMIDKYDNLLNKNWDLATEEQKARIEKIKTEVNKINGTDLDIEDTSETDKDIYGY